MDGTQYEYAFLRVCCPSILVQDSKELQAIFRHSNDGPTLLCDSDKYCVKILINKAGIRENHHFAKIEEKPLQNSLSQMQQHCEIVEDYVEDRETQFTCVFESTVKTDDKTQLEIYPPTTSPYSDETSDVTKHNTTTLTLASTASNVSTSSTIKLSTSVAVQVSPPASAISMQDTSCLK